MSLGISIQSKIDVLKTITPIEIKLLLGKFTEQKWISSRSLRCMTRTVSTQPQRLSPMLMQAMISTTLNRELLGKSKRRSN